MVVAIDAKRQRRPASTSSRAAAAHRRGRDAVEWAVEAEARGAGEILLTSIDRDGTRAGFDCELTAAVSTAVSIPVIASGGAGTFDHFADVFTTGRADAALAASIFHFSEHAVAELKRYLREQGHSSSMLIPSIDLQGGRIVQLVQGERLAVETDDVDAWMRRFARLPEGAADRSGCGQGRRTVTTPLVARSAPRFPCRVGGGIRTDRAGRGDPRRGREEGDPADRRSSRTAQLTSNSPAGWPIESGPSG